MLRMVICCGGGYSSSFMAQRVRKEVKDKGYEELIMVDFLPFRMFKENYEAYDVAFLCPHLLYDAKNFANTKEMETPMYIIPSKMYGTMRLNDLIEDAKDIIQLYRETKNNPIHFEDEDFLELRRDVSHRQWKTKAMKSHMIG